MASVSGVCQFLGVPVSLGGFEGRPKGKTGWESILGGFPPPGRTQTLPTFLVVRVTNVPGRRQTLPWVFPIRVHHACQNGRNQPCTWCGRSEHHMTWHDFVGNCGLHKEQANNSPEHFPSKALLVVTQTPEALNMALPLQRDIKQIPNCSCIRPLGPMLMHGMKTYTMSKLLVDVLLHGKFFLPVLPVATLVGKRLGFLLLGFASWFFLVTYMYYSGLPGSAEPGFETKSEENEAWPAMAPFLLRQFCMY